MQPNDEKEELLKSIPSTVEKLKAAAYCCFYLLIGPMLIMVNRNILVNTTFKYPIMLTALGQLSTAIAVAPLAYTKTPKSIPFILHKVVPIGALSAITLCTGNASYMYMPLSLAQILKAITPVLLTIVLWGSTNEQPPAPIIASVCMMTVGMMLSCVSHRGQYHAFGIGLGVCACVSEVARLLLTQNLLSGDIPAVQGVYYTALVCTVWLGAFSAVIELPLTTTNDLINAVQTNRLMFITAMGLAVSVNVVSIFVIKISSSLTLKLMGNARNAALVLFSVVFLEKGKISMPEGIGYTLCLLSFATYSYFRNI